MDSTVVSVMYIGSKKEKYDNVNGNITRRWQGAGDIVDEIPKLQGAKLVAHKDEFIDVTVLDEKARIARAGKAKADVDALMRKVRSGNTSGGTLLSYATDEDLEAEFERRRAEKKAAKGGEPADKKAKAASGTATAPGMREGKEAVEKIRIALEAVVTRQSADDVDKEGKIKKSAVEEVLGFPVSDAAFAEAMGIDLGA